MCGRFTLQSAPRVKLNGVRSPDLPFEARYNIAPTQEVFVVADFGNGPELRKLVWGLIPARSTDGKIFINARAETIDSKPSFSESFRRRRCLILADGFFEWKRSGKAKQAYYFQLSDESTFAFAGIWESRGPQKTCAIVTTTANEALASIHDRMPVILPPENYQLWLDPKTDLASLRKLLVPFPASTMSFYPVSTAVNSAQNEGAELIKREDCEIGTTPSLF
ncbi:MAG TPA: SOS response-associated peptidase [Pyrinomonadaceae bacterium]|nr:SOS response-associated peptidase [Pyrinomonadaceae bacterium]